MVLNDLPETNWSYHVLVNRNSLAPNLESNFPGWTQWWFRPMWVNPSPQIRINKGSATDHIYTILLRLTIHGHIFNSYFTQAKTGKMFLLRNTFQMQVQINIITWSVRKESEGMLQIWSNQWSEDGKWNFTTFFSLLKVYTYPLPEYDNWNFSRGYSTSLSVYRSTTWR